MRCISLCCRRSRPACPRARNDEATTFSRAAWPVPSPATPPRSALQATITRAIDCATRLARMPWSLPAQRRRVHLCTAGQHPEIHRQIDGRRRAEQQLRQAFLTHAVRQSPLHRAYRTVRNAVRGPVRKSAARALRPGQIRKLLQSNPLAVGAVAARAREVVWTGAPEKQVAATRVRVQLVLRLLRHPDRCPARLG